MRAFCQTRLIRCEEASPCDPQSAWGSTKTTSNINVELFDPAPIGGQDSEPIHKEIYHSADKGWNAHGSAKLGVFVDKAGEHRASLEVIANHILALRQPKPN